MFRDNLGPETSCKKLFFIEKSWFKYPPVKMEQTQCSETSPYKIQTPGNYPEKAHSIQNKAKIWNQVLIQLHFDKKII
jgi:hypothetical protein